MQVESILSPGRARCCVPATSKKRALEIIAQFVAGDLGEHVDAAELFASLLARERLGSTGFGDGIAIPHCRSKLVDSAVGCLMSLEQPIEFESVDEKPVDLLFALLVPEEATEEHLNLLAGLAERFSDSDYCDALRAARTDEALYRAAVERDRG